MRSSREKEWITNKTADITKKFHKSEVGSYECNENSMERNQLDNNRGKKVTKLQQQEVETSKRF
jgi:hypothetical protein